MSRTKSCALPTITKLKSTLDPILAPAPKDGEAGAAANLVALALDLILILALTPEDGEAGAATNLCALALYLRGVTALNVTPH